MGLTQLLLFRIDYQIAATKNNISYTVLDYEINQELFYVFC